MPASFSYPETMCCAVSPFTKPSRHLPFAAHFNMYLSCSCLVTITWSSIADLAIIWTVMICGSSDLYYKIISTIMRKWKNKLSIFKERTMAVMGLLYFLVYHIKLYPIIIWLVISSWIPIASGCYKEVVIWRSPIFVIKFLFLICQLNVALPNYMNHFFSEILIINIINEQTQYILLININFKRTPSTVGRRFPPRSANYW